MKVVEVGFAFVGVVGRGTGLTIWSSGLPASNLWCFHIDGWWHRLRTFERFGFWWQRGLGRQFGIRSLWNRGSACRRCLGNDCRRAQIGNVVNLWDIDVVFGAVVGNRTWMFRVLSPSPWEWSRLPRPRHFGNLTATGQSGCGDQAGREHDKSRRSDGHGCGFQSVMSPFGACCVRVALKCQEDRQHSLAKSKRIRTKWRRSHAWPPDGRDAPKPPEISITSIVRPVPRLLESPTDAILRLVTPKANAPGVQIAPILAPTAKATVCKVARPPNVRQDRHNLTGKSDAPDPKYANAAIPFAAFDHHGADPSV